jgi:hypothetical protein
MADATSRWAGLQLALERRSTRPIPHRRLTAPLLLEEDRAHELIEHAKNSARELAGASPKNACRRRASVPEVPCRAAGRGRRDGPGERCRGPRAARARRERERAPDAKGARSGRHGKLTLRHHGSVASSDSVSSNVCAPSVSACLPQSIVHSSNGSPSTAQIVMGLVFRR